MQYYYITASHVANTFLLFDALCISVWELDFSLSGVSVVEIKRVFSKITNYILTPSVVCL